MVSEIDYFRVRDALIALLCVGDKINCIHSGMKDKYKGMMGYNHEPITLYETHNTIIEYTVVAIVDNATIRLSTPKGNIYDQQLHFMYAYEGQLYIWNGDKLCNFSHEERLKMVIDAIESNNTLWMNDRRV
jgi:hypothetical protein